MTDAEHYKMLADQYAAMAQMYREVALQIAITRSQQAEYLRKEQAALKLSAEYEQKAKLYEK